MSVTSAPASRVACTAIARSFRLNDSRRALPENARMRGGVLMRAKSSCVSKLRKDTSPLSNIFSSSSWASPLAGASERPQAGWPTKYSRNLGENTECTIIPSPQFRHDRARQNDFCLRTGSLWNRIAAVVRSGPGMDRPITGRYSLHAGKFQFSFSGDDLRASQRSADVGGVAVAQIAAVLWASALARAVWSFRRSVRLRTPPERAQ